MALRDAGVSDRSCSSLELLFDIGFIVTVGRIVAGLRDTVLHGHTATGAAIYLALFLPVCWSWMHYSWFSAAYDNDDVVTRVLALAQLAGLVALTATVPAAFEGKVAPFATAYLLMRAPLVVDWTRAALRATGEGCRYARRNAVGLAGCLAGWLLLVAAPETLLATLPTAPVPVAWMVLMAAELGVPVWAAAGAGVPMFHARHLGERFGGFTMIVLGELVVAAAAALQESGAHEAAPAVVHGVVEALPAAPVGSVAAIGVAVLLAGFAVWWLYADGQESGPSTDRATAGIWWGHGQLLGFASVAAMGAGGEVAVAVAAEGLPFTAPMQAAVVAPAAATLLALAWAQHTGPDGRIRVATRLLAAPVVVVAGLHAAADGPVAATVAVAVTLLLTVATETICSGLRLRGAGPVPGPVPA